MTDVQLPPLPEPNVSGYPSKDDPDERLSYSVDALQEYGEACARAAVLAERELWDLLDKHGICLSRDYIRNASGNFDGWWGCGPKGDFIGRGATMYEAALACAEAIRKGE